eukprot:Phypoly_transcript_13067.p2 GENE.Phypoly_transcript_13067~~Phypoly_transcript_13067.p2  ORF type:complete len:141 (-),score=28.85 Phypoly_transcript_13067:136-558(-)
MSGEKEVYMCVFAKLPSGRSVPLNIYNVDKIENAKCILSDTGGIPAEEQELYYGDKPLSDDKTFAYYNIKNESVIHVKIKAATSNNNNNNGAEPDENARQRRKQKYGKPKNKQNNKKRQKEQRTTTTKTTTFGCHVWSYF